MSSSFRETKNNHEIAPKSGRFVKSGDLELYVMESGPKDGKPVVFIGGTGAWSGFWEETTLPFANKGFRTIAVDIPPFGFSDRPSNNSYGNSDQAKRLVNLFNELGLEKVILIGHSFGGGATVETALMIPDRVEALVLIDVGGLNFDINKIQNPSSVLGVLLRTPFIRNPILASTFTNPIFTKKLLSMMIYDSTDATDMAVNTLREPLKVRGTTDAIGGWLNFTLTNNNQTLTSNHNNYKTLKMPTLIIWGDNDTVIPFDEALYIQNLIENSQLVSMNDVNHIPHLEDSETFVDIVFNFLKKLRD